MTQQHLIHYLKQAMHAGARVLMYVGRISAHGAEKTRVGQ
jgi:hypothetical protein